MNIEKLYDIWANLDRSYEINKNKLGVSNKMDYLKSLCLDKNGNSLLPLIRVLLKKDCDILGDSMSDRIMNKYSLVVDVIDSLEYAMSIDKDLFNNETNSLNEEVFKFMSLRKYSTLEKKIDSEEFKDLFKLDVAQDYMSSMMIFKKFGEAGKFTKKVNNVIRNIEVKDDIFNKFIYVNLTNYEYIADLLKKIQGGNENLNEYYDFIYNCAMVFNDVFDAMSPINHLVIDKSYLINDSILGRKVIKVKDDTYSYKKNILVHLV